VAASHFELLACGNGVPDVSVSLVVQSEHPAVIVARLGDEKARQYPGTDLFDCLLSLREDLESHGLLLCCQGARKNVSPSGMTRQMSNGRLAYALPLGRQVSDDDLVEVFAPADCGDVASIVEQKEEIKKILLRR
jgi:hypothetical protein